MSLKEVKVSDEELKQKKAEEEMRAMEERELEIKEKAQELILNVKSTKETCWRCNSPLMNIIPAYQGFSYYCTSCNYLTSTRGVISEAMKASLNRGATVVIKALPCVLEILFE